MVRERHRDDINVFLNRIYSTPHFLGNSCQSDRRRTEIVLSPYLVSKAIRPSVAQLIVKGDDRGTRH